MDNLTLTTADKLKVGDCFFIKDDTTNTMCQILPLKCSKKGYVYIKKRFKKATDMISIKQQIIFVK